MESVALFLPRHLISRHCKKFLLIIILFLEGFQWIFVMGPPKFEFIDLLAIKYQVRSPQSFLIFKGFECYHYQSISSLEAFNWDFI